MHNDRPHNKDEEMREDIVQEIRKERKIGDTSNIRVSVKNGVVTLSGKVENFPDRMSAKEAAERVPGIKSLSHEVEVEPAEAHKRSDIEIARSAAIVLEHNSLVPAEGITITVVNGVIRLDGTVQDEDQKIEAGNTVSKVMGVKGLINNLVVKPIIKPSDIIQSIERRFLHRARHDALGIKVEVQDGKVILSGIVRAWVALNDAEEAAREVPGVTEVENRLELTPLLKGKIKPPERVKGK